MNKNEYSLYSLIENIIKYNNIAYNFCCIMLKVSTLINFIGLNYQNIGNNLTGYNENSHFMKMATNDSGKFSIKHKKCIYNCCAKVQGIIFEEKKK